MSTCTACGAGDQPDGARFCFSCGTPLEAPRCVACGTELVRGARFCSECGAVQGAPAAAQPGAAPVSARRVTSVLFGDLVGFTSLSEHRDQEDTRELLSRYFDECRQIISRYGGTVEKFIGDAVMAVWGVPTAHEDDAERSVRAGLELVDAVEAMGQEIGVARLAMRVGIVTGEVAVTVGAQEQGMVAGDAVNTASRVQSVAAPGQVWVDETTRLLTSSAITYLDAGSHRLKGKVDPVPLWSVHAVVAAVGGVQRADGLEAPLVGRDRELRLVKELFHGVEESRQPALLVMVGEPGVGKSRLAWEFEKYVDGLTMTTRWHNGRCVGYGEGMAFFALAEAIRARLRGLSPDLETDEAGADPTELLEQGLDRYVPDAEERTWLRPRLGALLGIGSVGTFPREDLFSAWTAFLERIGEGAYPVVLVLDDAHHADDGLVQFVEHLLAAGTFPCFVLLLSRPGLLERHSGLAANRRATVSHLTALPDADISTLLDGLVVGLPDTARDSLVARSEGVPLFAVETVRSLIDRDLVIPRGGQYVLADPDALDLGSIGAPASLQALIAARLDAPEQAVSLINLQSFPPHPARCALSPDVEDSGTSRAAQLLSLCPDRRADWLRPRLGALLGIGSVGTFPARTCSRPGPPSSARRRGHLPRGAGHRRRPPRGRRPRPVRRAPAGRRHLPLLRAAAQPARPAGATPRPGGEPTTRQSATSPRCPNSDISTLLDGLVVGLPDAARDSLVARSEGVPLFAVETVRSLIDRDLVIPRGGQYVLADPAALDLGSIGAPASLQALIAARLDALDREQRRLVERASVIGNVFSREEIVELCPDLADMDGLLAGLLRQQILSQMTSRFSAEFGQYQFVQSVVRQVAYATLARRDKRSLHLAVAHQNETVADPSGELAPIIAQHYLDAVAAMPEEPDVPELEARAIAELERAAARARALGALTESAGHLLLALERAHDQVTGARLDAAVAWALVDAGEYGEATPHAVAAVASYDLMGDAVAAGLAAAAQGTALSMSGDNAGSLAVVEPRWDALLDTPGADAALLALGKVLTTVSGRLGDDRREVLDRRIQIAEKIGNREELADSLTALSVSYSFLGASQTARILMSSAADIAREHHYPEVLARCLSNLTVEYFGENLERAVEIGQEAVDVAGRAGVAVWRDYSEANLALALLDAGRWSEVEDLLTRRDGQQSESYVIRVVGAGVRGFIAAARGERFETPWEQDQTRVSDDPSDRAWTALIDALASHTQGLTDLAVARAVEAAEGMYALSGTSDDFVHMWPVALDLAIANEDRQTALRLLAIVDDDVQRLKVPPAVQTHRDRLAGLLARTTEPELVEGLLRSALQGFTTWGSRHYRARVAGELGAWLRATGGDLDEASQLLEEARTALTELGARAWLSSLEDQQVAQS